MSEGARTSFYRGNVALVAPIGDVRGGRGKKLALRCIFSRKWEIFRFGAIFFSKNGEKYQFN